jgi:hypothetical protein
MKRKRLIFAASMLLLLLLVGTSAVYSLSFETDINYYYDDTFATWVGNHYTDCNANTWVTGTTGSWRIFDRYSCTTGQRTFHSCQQTNGQGGWISVGCPPWDP